MDLIRGYSHGGDKSSIPAKKATAGAKPSSSSSSSSRFGASMEDDCQSSTCDAAGVNNVYLRGPNSSQRLAGGNYSDLERVQAELKKIAGAHESQPAEEYVDDVQDQWFNRENSETDERLTHKLLDVPRGIAVPTHFQHNPHHYFIDYHEQTDKSLQQLNGGTWQEVCFPEDKPRGLNEPAPCVRSYHSPFPGQSSQLHVTDYHVHQSTHSTKLQFTLPNANQTHSAFVKSFRDGKDGSGGDGTVKIKIPLSVLKAQLQHELGSIDWVNTPYHINVFDINCCFEQSNFLVPFDKILTSASALEKDKLQSWSTSHGVNNAADNMVSQLTTDPAFKKFIYNPIRAGESCGAPLCPTMYIAPSYVNGAEHPRWINRNWKAIADDLTKLMRGNAYEIQLPPSSKFKDFNFLVWFIFDEMEHLQRLTAEFGETPTIQVGGKQMEFNKIYSTDSTESTAFTLINKRALDTLFRVSKIAHTAGLMSTRMQSQMKVYCVCV